MLLIDDVTSIQTIIPPRPTFTERPISMMGLPILTSFAILASLLQPYVRADCAWAGKYLSYTSLDCVSQQSTFEGQAGRYYEIRMSGTGQDISEWCNGISDRVASRCTPNAPLKRTSVTCYVYNEGGETALDGDNGWKPVTQNGMKLRFWLEADNHQCVATAIEESTCNEVYIIGGSSCYREEDPLPADDIPPE